MRSASSRAWSTFGETVNYALVATGVVIPVGLDAATLTNFAGYVAWCLWLIATACFLWRAATAAPRFVTEASAHIGAR